MDLIEIKTRIGFSCFYRAFNIEILYLSIDIIIFMKLKFYEKWQGGNIHIVEGPKLSLLEWIPNLSL